MNIALDYDKTVTEDPGFWHDVVKLAKSRGHQVQIVTYRSPEDKTYDLMAFAGNAEIPIVFTARQAKRKVCESLGISIDVWIDDQPELIVADSDWTPVQIGEWRKSHGL